MADAHACAKRNSHNRTFEDINKVYFCFACSFGVISVMIHCHSCVTELGYVYGLICSFMLFIDLSDGCGLGGDTSSSSET